MHISPEFREALALRYEVYCVEKGFLPGDQYTESEESDEFDEMSAHFIARLGGRVVGNMRLVRPFNTRFPFQQHCETFSDVKIRYRRSAEISRLAVAKMRLKEIGHQAVAALPDGRSVAIRDAIVLCLIKGALQHSDMRRIDFYYVAMERSLSRLLARLGITFSAIGNATDYYGEVVPSFAPRKTLLESMRAHNCALHAWMTDGQEPALGPVSVVTYDRSRQPYTMRPRLKMLVQSIAASLRRGRRSIVDETPHNRASGLFGSWGLRSKAAREPVVTAVLARPLDAPSGVLAQR